MACTPMEYGEGHVEGDFAPQYKITIFIFYFFHIQMVSPPSPLERLSNKQVQ